MSYTRNHHNSLQNPSKEKNLELSSNKESENSTSREPITTGRTVDFELVDQLEMLINELILTIKDENVEHTKLEPLRNLSSEIQAFRENPKVQAPEDFVIETFQKQLED